MNSPPSRRFRYRIRPTRPGAASLPPVAVAAFDPQTARYVTRVTSSIPIRVVDVPKFDPSTLGYAPASGAGCAWAAPGVGSPHGCRPDPGDRRHRPGGARRADRPQAMEDRPRALDHAPRPGARPAPREPSASPVRSPKPWPNTLSGGSAGPGAFSLPRRPEARSRRRRRTRTWAHVVPGSSPTAIGRAIPTARPAPAAPSWLTRHVTCSRRSGGRVRLEDGEGRRNRRDSRKPERGSHDRQGRALGDRALPLFVADTHKKPTSRTTDSEIRCNRANGQAAPIRPDRGQRHRSRRRTAR